jgi:hypothetical protein
VSLSEWLENKAGATRLEACELALGRFCAAADADEDYTRQIAAAVWSVLLSAPPSNPAATLQEIRGKMSDLGRNRLETLSVKLQDAMSKEGDIPREAGKLVACWFKAIALTMATSSHQRRALHVARAFEETFASLARLAEKRENRKADVQNASQNRQDREPGAPEQKLAPNGQDRETGASEQKAAA